MEEVKYLLMHHEKGVLGIGTRRAYGFDIVYFMDGVEFGESLDNDDEYQVIGEVITDDYDYDD